MLIVLLCCKEQLAGLVCLVDALWAVTRGCLAFATTPVRAGRSSRLTDKLGARILRAGVHGGLASIAATDTITVTDGHLVAGLLLGGNCLAQLIARLCRLVLATRAIYHIVRGLLASSTLCILKTRGGSSGGPRRLEIGGVESGHPGLLLTLLGTRLLSLDFGVGGHKGAATTPTIIVRGGSATSLCRATTTTLIKHHI